MTAMKIAPQRTFPKQLLEFVELLAVVFEAAGKFEADAFFQRKFHLILRWLGFQVRWELPVLWVSQDFQELRVQQVSF